MTVVCRRTNCFSSHCKMYSEEFLSIFTNEVFSSSWSSISKKNIKRTFSPYPHNNFQRVPQRALGKMTPGGLYSKQHSEQIRKCNKSAALLLRLSPKNLFSVLSFIKSMILQFQAVYWLHVQFRVVVTHPIPRPAPDHLFLEFSCGKYTQSNLEARYSLDNLRNLNSKPNWRTLSNQKQTNKQKIEGSKSTMWSSGFCGRKPVKIGPIKKIKRTF